jgi:oligopeptide/dipeptide ABC transporter ATP-binding protein
MTSPLPVLQTRGLTVTYRSRGLMGRKQAFTAVRDVSLDLARGQTLGLVGESGSGKSTTARAICGLAEYEGQILLSGEEARTLQGSRTAVQHRQMVFQDPYSSLDPLMTVGDSIAEPLVLLEGRRSPQHRVRVRSLLDAVRLPSHFAARLPKELSGGQRQRVAIARALATDPALVVCDEALSALDASTQGEVLGILQDLRDDLSLSYLFIAHDLAVVRHLADHIAVMYLGTVVESGPTEQVFRSPKHPYTRALLEAAPIPHPRLQRARRKVTVTGEPPDPSKPPAGCPFHPRCPLAEDRCIDQVPPETSGGGRVVRCHVNRADSPTLVVPHFDEPVGTRLHEGSAS